jgi:hypothetical protein
MIRLLFLLLCTAPLSAQREFPARVVLDFGGLQDNPANEINKMTTVVRTPRGQFVVALRDPVEVRLYDAAGKVIRRLGRGGEGPGEFRYAPMVRPWTGDSILTMSLGTQRWMLFGLDGKLVREWAVDSAHPDPRGLQMAGASFIRTGTIGRRGCIATVAAKLPPPAPWLPREALSDPAGRVWVRNSATNWRIYSADGAALGTVTLPARFQVQQFSGNLLTGHRFDEDGAEHVTVVEVTLPPAPAGSAPCDLPKPTGARVREFQTGIRNMMTAAEASYSDSEQYPTALDNRMFIGPKDSELVIIKASVDSWVAMLVDKLGSLRCITSMGPEGIPGWLPGAYGCSM